MRVMKLEEHLYFPSGFKNVSCTERLHSVWVGSKSGSKSSATKRAQHCEKTVICLAWLVSRPGLLSLVSKSEALAPVVSPASAILISSSPHTSRGHTKP